MDNEERGIEGTALSTHDLRVIYKELFLVRSKWRQIGIELDIVYGDLDAIAVKEAAPKDRLERVLVMWLSKGTATWRELIEALWSVPVGETALAEELRQKYCPQQIDQSSAQSRKRQHDDSDNSQDDRRMQQLNDIIDVETKFVHLQTSTRESLKRRGKSHSELAAHLLGFQSSIFSTTKYESCTLAQFQQGLRNADSIDAVFVTVAPLCSFLDYSILKDVIKTYGSKKDKKNLKDYTETVRQFLLKNRVSRFCKVSRHDLEDSSLVTFRIKLDTNLMARYDNVKAAIARILEIKTEALRVRSFDNGCVVLDFFCPKEAAHRLLSQNHAERSAALSMIEPSVLKVTISEEFTVYRKDTDCPQPSEGAARLLLPAKRRQRYLELRSRQSDHIPTWRSRMYQLFLLAGVITIIAAVLWKVTHDKQRLQIELKAARRESFELEEFIEYELIRADRALNYLAGAIKDADINDHFNQKKKFEFLLVTLFSRRCGYTS